MVLSHTIPSQPPAVFILLWRPSALLPSFFPPAFFAVSTATHNEHTDMTSFRFSAPCEAMEHRQQTIRPKAPWFAALFETFTAERLRSHILPCLKGYRLADIAMLIYVYAHPELRLPVARV